MSNVRPGQKKLRTQVYKRLHILVYTKKNEREDDRMSNANKEKQM